MTPEKLQRCRNCHKITKHRKYPSQSYYRCLECDKVKYRKRRSTYGKKKKVKIQGPLTPEEEAMRARYLAGLPIVPYKRIHYSAVS